MNACEVMRVNGVMAVFMIIFFIIVGAVILTGVGIVITNWRFPAEKVSQQQETDNSSANDNISL